MRTAANVAAAAVLLLWGLFLTAWLALHWAILPHIDEWRGRIEKLAGDAIGLPLSIGSIHVQSSGWVPAFELRDVRLFDHEGREALRLQRVQAALAPQSLLRLTLRFEQVLIDGARLEVRRDRLGRWQVAGLQWDGSVGSDDTRARDWFLRQHEFVVRQAELHWVDERSGAAPLVLTQLDLVLRNGLRRHALRLDATPPPQWGERFTLRGRFSQPLLAPPGELRRWSGTLFAEFPQADAAQMRRHVELPLELGEGDGALRAWVDFNDGVARRATLDFALRAVSVQLAASLQPLQLQQLQGRLDVERDSAGVHLRAHDLAFLTDGGVAWPAGELSVAWRQAQNLREPWTNAAPVTAGEVAGERLKLDALARIAESAPLGEPLRALLAGLAPSGTLDSLQARWAGPARPAGQLPGRRAAQRPVAAFGRPGRGRRPGPSGAAQRRAAAVGQRARRAGPAGDAQRRARLPRPVGAAGAACRCIAGRAVVAHPGHAGPAQHLRAQTGRRPSRNADLQGDIDATGTAAQATAAAGAGVSPACWT